MSRTKITALIVDDEKGCIENLHYSLAKLCPYIDVVASGSTLAEAIDKAAGRKIDVAFLDIELYNSNIFSVLDDKAGLDFKVVFVTAYQQYAIKAIKIEALDYILKPLCDDDISSCYTKLKKHFAVGHLADDSHSGTLNKSIVLRSLDKIYYVKPEDIYYMSGNGPYTEVTFMANAEIKSIVICKVLNKIEHEYDEQLFFRVHKSHIINLNKVLSVVTGGGMQVEMCNRKMIPIAKRRTLSFLSSLKNAH